MSASNRNGDFGFPKQNVASGNELSASAKASLVDVSGATLNFGDVTRPIREPFLTASLRARIQAKKQNILVDSAISNIEKVESSDIDAAAKDAVVATLNRSLAHQLNLEDVMNKAVSLPTLREDANPDDLKPEWADEFAEHAGSKYDTDAQELWARLLAGELNRPGPIPEKPCVCLMIWNLRTPRLSRLYASAAQAGSFRMEKCKIRFPCLSAEAKNWRCRAIH